MNKFNLAIADVDAYNKMIMAAIDKISERDKRIKELESRSVLDWTAKKPTVPGWYWVYTSKLSPSTDIVEIQSDGDDLFVMESRRWEEHPVSRFFPDLWAGPIPEPKEPKP